MTAKEPIVEKMHSAVEGDPAPWADIRSRLEEGGATWLTTVRPDGKPHLIPIGAQWNDGAYYFTTGQSTRKGSNLAENPHCAIAMANNGYDIVVEGEAALLTDEATLQKVAEIYRANGWPAVVKDGAFDAPFSAPTTGPAPYDVYVVTPTIAFALGTNEENVKHCTRYRF